MYQKRIFDNLPTFVRYVDESYGHGIIQHVSDSVQPQLDIVFDQVRAQEYLYDPRLTPSNFLDFLQQFVGLCPVGDKYLGLGLNPLWGDAQKRLVIARAWDYWQRKGTDWGVREAIALWLQWEPAHSDRLLIRLPFGKVPTNHPPGSWHWDTPYGAHLNQTYLERQHFGGGDDYTQHYEPQWVDLKAPDWEWDYTYQWGDRLLLASRPPDVNYRASHLGPQRPWMHFDLRFPEWNQIFPDIYELNPEIWSTHAVPTVFGWLNLSLREPLKIEESKVAPTYRTVTEFDVDGLHYGDYFPWHITPDSSHTVTTYEEQEFGLWPGSQWLDQWGGTGGEPLTTAERTVTRQEVVTGFYPGAQWGECFSARIQTTVEVQMPYDGNLARCQHWSDQQWHRGGALWYYPPGVNTTTEQASVQLLGGSPYYSPSYSHWVTQIDPGIPLVRPSSAANQWYSPYRTITIEHTETVVDPGNGCFPGLPTTVQAGYADHLIPGQPPESAAQLLKIIPATTTTTEIAPAFDGIYPPFRWYDWWLTISPDAAQITIKMDTADLDWRSVGALRTPTFGRGSLSGWGSLFEPPAPLDEVALPTNIASLGTITTPILGNTPTIGLSGAIWTPAPLDVVLTIDISRLSAVSTGTFRDVALTITSLPALQSLHGLKLDLRDITPIPTLNAPAIPKLETLVRKPSTNQPLTIHDWFFAAYRAAVFQTQTTPGGYAWDGSKMVIQDYFYPYEQGFLWYFGGAPGTPDRHEQVPIYRNVYLCNTINNWSTRTILWLREYKILLPHDEKFLLYDHYPIFEQVSFANKWTLLLETDQGLVMLKPVTIFWTSDLDAGKPVNRTQFASVDSGKVNLYLEFIFQPIESSHFHSASLLLEDEVLRFEAFDDPLDANNQGCFGFKFLVPLRFPTGATTVEDSMAIEEFFPLLLAKLLEMRAVDRNLAQRFPRLAAYMSQNPQPDIQTNYPVTSDALQTLLADVTTEVNRLFAEMELIRQMGGVDAFLEYDQAVPSAQWIINHGLGKYPSVSVVDDFGNDQRGVVSRPSENTAIVTFNRPVTGKAYLN